MSRLPFPYTIGYSHNSTLDTFVHAYEQKIYQLAQAHLANDIELTQSNIEFLTLGDIASNLLLIEKNENLEAIRQSKVYIEAEWKRFQKDGIDALLSKKGKKIPWTNILLTENDYTPGGVARINHPSQKDGEKVSWFSTIDEQDWLTLYAKVFDTLRAIDPWFYSEITQVLQKIVPIGISKDSHNSGSFSDCIGHIYMSYPIWRLDPVIAVLEAVIHEYNHNKLHIIKISDPLITNSWEEIYYSPYRPDARHLNGIYAWLHALTAVIFVMFSWLDRWAILYDESLVLKSILYFMKDAASIRVLEKYGNFTELGLELLKEMKELQNSTLELIKKQNYSRALLDSATYECRKHFIEAQKNNKVLIY